MKIWLKNSFNNGIISNNNFNDSGVWCASCTRRFELASRPYFRLYCRCLRPSLSLPLFQPLTQFVEVYTFRNMLMLFIRTFFSFKLSIQTDTRPLFDEKRVFIWHFWPPLLLSVKYLNVDLSVSLLHHDNDDDDDKSIEGECIYFY